MMKRVFTYMIQTTRYSFDAHRLGEWGREGWELVAVVPERDNEFTRYFFKRESLVIK